jgi:hypothetical protein
MWHLGTEGVLGVLAPRDEEGDVVGTFMVGGPVRVYPRVGDMGKAVRRLQEEELRVMAMQALGIAGVNVRGWVGKGGVGGVRIAPFGGDQ